MLKNDLKSALRSLRRHLGYTSINVVGLAVGIAVCLLITLYVRYELSYDDFHEDADRIVRVVSDWGDFSVPATNPPMLRALKSEWPNVPMATLNRTGGLVAHQERQFEVDNIYFANPGFFDVFSFDLKRGSPDDVLTRPFTVVLTPEMAERYFPDADPIGKTVTLENQFEAEVTGIVEPAPETSHFHYDVLVSWNTLNAVFNLDESQNWSNNAYHAYLKAPRGRSLSQMDAQLSNIRKQHGGAEKNTAALSLQPITSIHLYSNHDAELEANGNVAYVWLFGIVAVFVLILACVNFTNLATARGLERAREVGVRKAVGAGQRQLIRQFLVEAVVLAGTGLLLAVALAAAAMPLFRTLTGTSVTLGVLAEPFTVVALLAITMTAALGAGGYPAFVLSRFDPVEVLRGRSRDGGRGATLRKGLVVFQFATAVTLIAGTLVAFWQLDYLRSANLGFDQERVLTLNVPGNAAQSDRLDRASALPDELLQTAGVEAVSMTSERFPSELLNGAGITFEGAGVAVDTAAGLRAVAVAPGYFEALGVDPIAGRTFSRGRADTTGFVVNRAGYERIVQQMPEPPASPREAIGRPMVANWTSRLEGPLLGVVENFHLATLRERVEPMVFFYDPQFIDTYLVRLAPGDVRQTLDQVETTWQRVFPDWPFQYQFADQAFDAAYRAEQQMGRLFGVFAGLAILIACLGLFGLAAYTAQQRTKEIGIRKAVGASVPQIVGLLTKDFALLVLGAIVVAVPVAYVGLHRWLETFAYHVELGPTVFLLAGGGALLVAVLTVAVHAFRAARIDPAQVLRSE